MSYVSLPRADYSTIYDATDQDRDQVRRLISALPGADVITAALGLDQQRPTTATTSGRGAHPTRHVEARIGGRRLA